MILNRTGIGGFALLSLCVCATQSAWSADRGALPGWGPFKFSMSFAEAKAAAGPRGIINAAGNIDYETVVDGRPFDASISFSGGDERIQWVELAREGVENFSAAECHGEREALERSLSLTYGKPDARGVEKRGSMPGTRSRSTMFLFGSGAEIQLYEQWRSDRRSAEKCAISIVYRPAATRAKENF